MGVISVMLSVTHGDFSDANRKMRVPRLSVRWEQAALYPSLRDAYEYNYTYFSAFVPTPFSEKGWENENFHRFFAFF